MAGKHYEINLMFSTGTVERTTAHKFKTQKAAREWCARAGMVPIFGGARPCMFWSAEPDRYGRRAIQATIREAGRVLWPEGSTEGRAARRIAKSCI